MPPAFQAFYALHHARYSAYAQAHLTTSEAEAVVGETFGNLVTHWPYIVSRPNPTAHAWQQLVDHVHSRSPRLPLPARSPLHYATLILHHILGYPIKDTADATGQEPSKIRYLALSGEGQAFPPSHREQSAHG
ncbi:hypothetical protein [Streptomyces antimycoticus]